MTQSGLPITDGTVTLRAFDTADAAALIDGRDAEFHRYLGEGAARPEPVACIVVEGTVVGWIDHDSNRTWLTPGQVNLGYHVFAPHRRRGYALRALQLYVQVLRDDSDVTEATLLIAPDNVPSLSLAARSGFDRAPDVDELPFFTYAMSTRNNDTDDQT